MGNIRKFKLFTSKWFVGARVVCFVAVICPGYYHLFFVHKANFREVVAGKVYRSTQPLPAHLEKWIGRYGIRTIINLRGDAGKVTSDEQAVADKLGVNMITFRLKSKEPVPKDSLAELIKIIETAEQPVLMHCSGGTERTGVASTLAAMTIGKENYDTAKWQAYVPPGPWKRKKHNNYSHISDIFISYERYCRRNELNTNGWEQFKQWTIDAESLADGGSKYKFTHRYFPPFDETRRFYPIAKLARGAYVQFSVELILLSVLAAAIYRKLPGD